MNNFFTLLKIRIQKLKLHLVLPSALMVFMSSFTTVSANFQNIEYDIIFTPDHFPIIFPKRNADGDPVDYGQPQEISAANLLTTDICGSSNNCSLEAKAAGAVYYKVSVIAGVSIVFYYDELGKLIGTQKVSELPYFNFISHNNSNVYNPVASLDSTALEKAFPTDHEAFVVGTSTANFNVTPSGGVSYSVPVTIPPALNGLQPEIALNYNSQGGNGLLGVGFSVGGLSSISRCGKTALTDGIVQKVKPVKYNNEDAFCLDGQRLIKISGTHGAVNAQYKTEIDNFSIVTIKAANSLSPTEFEVETKSGQIFTYAGNINLIGNSNNSLNNKIAMLWPVTQIKDISNQIIQFNYEENNNGTTGFRPLSIIYGGDTVAANNPKIKFEYAPRTDTAIGYSQGFKISSPKRLKKIIVSIGGNQLVRQYNIVYDSLSTTYKSRIKQILECTSAEEPVNGVLTNTLKNNCLAPITFDWSEGPNGLTDMGQLATGLKGDSYNKLGQFQTLDVNYDGYTDTLIGPNSSGYWYSIDGRKLTSHIPNSITEVGGAWLLNYFHDKGNRVRPMDVNGDGKVEIVLGPHRNSPRQFFTVSAGSNGQLSNASPFNSYRSTFWGNNPEYTHAIDVNGDGKQDLVLGPDHDGDGYIHLSNGSSFNRSAKIWSRISVVTSKPWYGNKSILLDHSYILDINGDGLSDMLFGPDQYGRWDILKATGTSYQTVLNYTTSSDTSIPYACLYDDYQDPCSGYVYRGYYSQGSSNTYKHKNIRFLDINGDGLSDMLIGPSKAGRWSLKMNTGTGFTGEAVLFTNKYPNWDDDYANIRAIDVNVDGLTDIVLGPDVNGKWHWLRSDGVGLVDEHEILTAYGGFHKKASNLRLGDADGDGMLDIILTPSNSSGLWYGVKLNGGHPDKITGIKNGASPKTNINYALLTKGGDSLFTKGTTDTATERSIVSPMQVVQSVTKGNGIGGFNETSYHYEDLKVDLQGRGLKGFRIITKTDNISNSVTKTTYKQDFPFIGSVEQIESSVANKKTELTTMSYDENTLYGGKIHQPITTLSTTESYNFNNSASYKVVTTTIDKTNVDKDGNTLELETKTTDPVSNEWWAQTTVSSYNFGARYGRLDNSTVTHSSSDNETPPITRESAFTYYPNGQLKTETIEPNANDLTLKKITTYTYDNYGLKNSVEEKGYLKDGTEILRKASTLTTIDTLKDSAGPTLKTVITNHNDDTETTWTSLVHGGQVAHKGPNGLESSATYTSFGRKKTSTNILGVTSNTDYEWVTATSGVQHALYKISTHTTGLQDTKSVIKDVLNRELRTQSHALDGREIVKETEYNAKGLIERANRPYLAYNTPVWLCFDYDAMGRVIYQNEPASANPSANCDDSSGRIIKETQYAGLTTTSISAADAQGLRHVKVTTKNVMDKVVNVIDKNDSGALQATLSYTHDVMGNLKTVTDSNAKTTTIIYDKNGRKTSMLDPSMGTWTYEYNSFGELTKQTDAKDQIVKMKYDNLGRMIERTEGVNQQDIWSWNYAEANDPDSVPVGKLKEIIGPNGYKLTYAYRSDLQTKSTTEIQKINGSEETLTQSFTYDNFGRVSSITNPQDFKVINEYNRYGFLVAVKSPSTPVSSEILAKLATLKQQAEAKIAEAETKSTAYMNQAYSYQQKAIEYETYARAQLQQKAYEIKTTRWVNSNTDNLYSAANELRDISIVLIKKADEQRIIIKEADEKRINAKNLAANLSDNVTETHRASARQFAQVAISNLEHAKSVLQKYRDPNGIKYLQGEFCYWWFSTGCSIPSSTKKFTGAKTMLDLAYNMLTSAQTAYTDFQDQQALAERYELYAAGITDDMTAGTAGELSQTTWWRVASADAEGRITESHQGNGTITYRDYDSSTGLLKSIKTTDGVNTLQELEYIYDNLNNITLKRDISLNYQESYQYDGLDRIKQAIVTVNGISKTRDYNYNSVGDLAKMGDKVLNYDEASGRLTEANGQTIGYDNNGNITTLDDGKTIGFSSFNKPITLSKGNKIAEFTYNAGRSRMLKVSKVNGQTVKTTRYFGGYEKITDSSANVEHRYHIKAGGALVAIHKVNNQNPSGLNSYIHTDNLGSTSLITNASASILSVLAYTPFGANRNLTGAISLTPFISLGIANAQFNPSLTNRGYTGHEHIEELDLIHMNGRVYDPSIGRFLSADPNIQMPTNTQGYNRYAYVQNNPLKYTDPSGYFLSSLFKSVGRFIKTYARQIVIMVVSYYTAGAFQAYGAFAQGFAGGFVGGLLGSGGDLNAAFTAGVFGGISAGLANEIGYGYLKGTNPSTFAQSLKHGLSQGFVGVLRGGRFKEGFLSGFAGHYIPDYFKEGLKDAGVSTRTAFAAMSGGIVAKLGGGKFENGAKTAAFVHLFNAAWKGTGSIKSYTGKYGVGGAVGTFDLVSQCDSNGRQVVAELEIKLGLLGVGPPSQDNFTLSLEDYDNSVDINNLLGEVNYSSAGLNLFGFDRVSGAHLQIGNAIMQNMKATGGFSVGFVGAFYGSSKLKNGSYSLKNCSIDKL